MRLKNNKSSFLSTPPTSTSKNSQVSAPSSITTLSLSSLQAIKQSSKSKMHWDNACSYHVTNDPSLLCQMRPIKPDAFIGVGGSGYATHVGYLPFLPSINHLNVGYYAPDFPQTLLSLGQLQACGGGYSTMGSNHLRISAVSSNPNTVRYSPARTRI